MRRISAVTAATVSVGGLLAGPAQAGSGGSDQVRVTIADVVLAGYACTSAPVDLAVDVPAWAGWAVSVIAAPTGTPRLDAVGFGGRGPGSLRGSLLICPADSAGTWTATVTSRVLLSMSEFTVTFNVGKQQTSTVLTRVRSSSTIVRVRGSVLSTGGFAGRAPLSVQGLRPNGKWRLLGHTAANRKGVFRFDSPVSVRAVKVDYPGDNVTLASRARARAERIK